VARSSSVDIGIPDRVVDGAYAAETSAKYSSHRPHASARRQSAMVAIPLVLLLRADEVIQ